MKTLSKTQKRRRRQNRHERFEKAFIACCYVIVSVLVFGFTILAFSECVL